MYQEHQLKILGRASERIGAGNTFTGTFDSKQKKSENQFYRGQVSAMQNLIISIDRARRGILGTRIEEFGTSF